MRPHSTAQSNSNMKLVLIIIGFQLMVCINSIWAQNSVDLGDSTSNNGYIQHINDKISFKLDFNSFNETFSVKNPDYSYDIRPNITINNKIWFNYRFLSLGYSFLSRVLPGNTDDDKGTTSGFGIDAHIYVKQWVQDFKYNEAKGFYLYNSDDFNKRTGTYIILPDLKVTSFRGSTSYFVNPNFSLRNIRTQTQIQLKSAGSLAPGLLYAYYDNDDKGFTQQQTSNQRTQTYELMLNTWYYYTLVINRNWYVAGGLAPSLGFAYTNLTTRYPDKQTNTNYTNPQIRMNSNFGFGYNTQKWCTGFEMSSFKSFRKDNDPTIKVITSAFSFQAFVGYRFNAPKKVKQVFKYVESSVAPRR